MGTNAIISVVGLLVIVTILTSSIGRKDDLTIDNSYGYLKYTAARDLARNSIQLTLRRIDTLSALPSTFTVVTDLDGGRCSVRAVTSGDTLRLHAVGRYQDSVYRVRATLLRYPKPFPPSAFKSALGLRPDPIRFEMKGTSALIDGREHDTTGALSPDRSNDVPAVLVSSERSRDSVIQGVEPKDTLAQLQGSERITVGEVSDPYSFVDELIAQADYTYRTPPNKDLVLSAQTWGSPSDPKIVFCDALDTNKIKIGGSTVGWGILVVRGSIELSGTTRWYGLVIGYGSTIIEFKTDAGNPKIIGSFLLGGAPDSKFDMRGNGNILYSRMTLTKAKNVGKLLYWSIVDWYE